ncbi:MotA/TolQ/ExbB proton channel family protein [Vulgatibacter sp.]|uniref:MotA/TolQ/ExbB proton channel family protein n=1 Tax=Vulgatibacter sp. TaxID=1971226 RepID=UPI00356665D5
MEIVFFLKNLLVASGTAWVLWLLVALSVGSVGVIVERALVFRARSADLRALTGALDAALARGATTEAQGLLEREPSLAARVAIAGLRLADHGAEAAHRGMESAMAVERAVLDKRLAYLGTLGNNAPFVGLFGTVIGVILAFDALGTEGAAGAAAGQAASAAVMAAIAEALVATAVGIAVALPAVAAYNYFQRRIACMVGDAEALTKLVLAYLSSERVTLAEVRQQRREVA